MDFIRDFINTYGATILYAVITAIAGYIGVAIKRIYNKYVDDKTKEKVARICVRAVEQMYKELHGDEKLNKCLEAASQMLAKDGIIVTDLELRMLIEAAVNEFNNGFNRTEDNNGEEMEE